MACESLESRQLLSVAGLSHVRHGAMTAHFNHVRARAVAVRGLSSSTTTTANTTASQGAPSTTTTTAPSTATAPGTDAATTTAAQAVDPGGTPSTPATPTPNGAMAVTGGSWGDAGFGKQVFVGNKPGGGLGGGGIGGVGGLGGLIGQALSGPAPTAAPGTSGQGGSTTPTQLQTDLKKLQTDTQAINDKSQVTPALLAAVRNDVQKIQSEATTQPDQAKLATLETDVKAINGQLPTDAQKTQLTSDFTAVVQSEGVSDATLIGQTITDIEAVVTATNITSDDLATIAADQKAIQADLGSATGATATTAQAAGADFLDGLTGGSLASTSSPLSGGSFAASGAWPGGPMGMLGQGPGGPMLARGGGGHQGMLSFGARGI